MSSVDRNKSVVRRVFEEILNGRNLDLIEELYVPDIVDHDPLPGAPDGIEGVRYSISGLLAAFPDLHVTIEDLSAHGDKVVVHNTWRGTQTGKLVGLPPTGRALTFTGIVVWRLADGRIAERWAMLDLVSKLGVASRRARRRRGGLLELDEAVTPYVSLQPIPPDKFDPWLRFNEEMAGPRRRDYEESRRRLGISRELAWLVLAPTFGDLRFEIVYFEVEDLARFGRGLAGSQAPFDLWFREQVRDLHGIDLTELREKGPSSRLIFEWTRSRD